jgi:hypothetical protein
MTVAAVTELLCAFTACWQHALLLAGPPAACVAAAAAALCSE